MGVDAGQVLTTGSNNTLIGYQAGMSSSPATMVTGSNTVVLGNNSVTGFSCKVSLTSGSDGRDKADITPFNHGLSWIKKLNPVTYRWDNRSDYSDDLSVTPDGTHKKPKLDIGLIAQEELEIEKEHGFGNDRNSMLIANEDDAGTYSLKYERLVPVLINAVKELSAENTALKARLDAAGL